jgi:methionyl-tRNA synthetase
MSEQKPVVSFEDFSKLDMRVAKVVEVSDHPNADKLLVMQIDLGDERRQIIAGLKGHYAAESLVGRQLVVVTNLQPRKMRGLESAGMLLAAVWGEGADQKVVVLTTESDVPPGTAIA